MTGRWSATTKLSRTASSDPNALKHARSPPSPARRPARPTRRTHPHRRRLATRTECSPPIINNRTSRSTPARPGSLESSNLLGIVVDTDLLSMIHAYTVGRTLPPCPTANLGNGPVECSRYSDHRPPTAAFQRLSATACTGATVAVRPDQTVVPKRPRLVTDRSSGAHCSSSDRAGSGRRSPTQRSRLTAPRSSCAVTRV